MMKRWTRRVGLVMQGVGFSIILHDLMSWLEGQGAHGGFVWGVGLLLIGSYIAPLQKKVKTTEALDISEIEYKLIYKEHDGKLWRYISLPDLNDERAKAQANEGYAQYIGSGFRQAVVKPGTKEWRDYYINKRKNRRTKK